MCALIIIITQLVGTNLHNKIHTKKDDIPDNSRRMGAIIIMPIQCRILEISETGR